MKIGELNQHCGECKIIDLCGEPYSNICLCCNSKLEEMTEDEYIEKVEPHLILVGVGDDYKQKVFYTYTEIATTRCIEKKKGRPNKV